MLKVEVKFRPKSQSRIKKKITIIFVNFAVTFRILQSYFKSCSHVIADFEKLQSHFEVDFAVTFQIMTQNVEICSHNWDF